jgi:hypothetical protein
MTWKDRLDEAQRS